MRFASHCLNPGPRRLFRPQVPSFPSAGFPKAVDILVMNVSLEKSYCGGARQSARETAWSCRDDPKSARWRPWTPCKRREDGTIFPSFPQASQSGKLGHGIRPTKIKVQSDILCRTDRGSHSDCRDSPPQRKACRAATVCGIIVNTVRIGEVVLRIDVVPISLAEGGLKRIVVLISIVRELHDVIVGWSQRATNVSLENRVKRPAAIKRGVVARGTRRSSLLPAIVAVITSQRPVIQASLVKKVLPLRSNVGNGDYTVLEDLVLDGGRVVVNSGVSKGETVPKMLNGGLAVGFAPNVW